MIYRTLVILALLLCLSAEHGLAQKRKTVYRGNIATVSAESSPSKLSPEVERRYSAFVEVWTAIKEGYFDPTFSNLDWDKIRAEFEPQVRAAKSDQEAHNLLGRMVGRLKRSHLAIIPPEVYQAIESAKVEAKAREKERSGTAGPEIEEAREERKALDLLLHDPSMRYGLGIDLALLDDRFVITRVDKNSAAENAGLKLGYSIETVNGVSLQALLDRVMIYYASIQTTSIKHHIPAEIVESIINGDRDSHVEVTFSDSAGASRQLRILREPMRREHAVTIAPNFPERTLSFESRVLNDSTGYIRFNHFAASLVPKFCEAIGEHSAREALIIDLRGNSGGLLAALPVMVGMLTTTALEVGTMKYRSSDQPLMANPRAKHFDGRIVVLVDSRTASAGEIFAIALRDHGRALLIGEKTSGEALPSIAVRLSTGAMLLYPIANFKSPSGKVIEGTGLTPDTVVTWDRKSLLEGKDMQLEAAQKLSSNVEAFATLKVKLPSPPPLLAAPASGQPPLPPPPPPASKAKVTGSGSGAGSSAPRTFKIVGSGNQDTRVFPPGHDATAKRILDDFMTVVGGKNAVKSVSKFKLKGTARIARSVHELEYDLTAFREMPGKYAENLTSDTMGETRQVTVGKKASIQSGLGFDMDIPVPLEAKEVDPLATIFELADAAASFPSLSYTGEYLRDGRKTLVLEGRLTDGSVVALAFDVESKMLVNFTTSTKSISFGDYRKVGTLHLPFAIDRGGTQITVSEYSLNQPIDPAEFEKKKFCFDTP